MLTTTWCPHWLLQPARCWPQMTPLCAITRIWCTYRRSWGAACKTSTQQFCTIWWTGRGRRATKLLRANNTVVREGEVHRLLARKEGEGALHPATGPA